jgi:hypothetical protein
MEAPLSICTKQEMRVVIRFLSAEGVEPVEIIRRMQAQYGDNCLSRSNIFEWIDHFKKGRTNGTGKQTNHSGQNFERFHITGPMKEALSGRFSSDEKVSGVVQNWLKTQPKNFFLTELKTCETLEPVR